MVASSWLGGDGELENEGDASAPCGMSEMEAIIQLMLSVRAGLKLSDFINLLSEKTLEEFQRMK